jgi:hypothetical protein
MQLLFWPLMIASVIFSIVGIIREDSFFLYVSAVFIIPLSLYLAATPRFEFWGLVFPLFYIVAAIFIKRNKIWLSLLFSTPNFLLIGWLGFVVFT